MMHRLIFGSLLAATAAIAVAVLGRPAPRDDWRS